MAWHRKHTAHYRTVKKGTVADELLNPPPQSSLGVVFIRQFPADVRKVKCGGGYRILKK